MADAAYVVMDAGTAVFDELHQPMVVDERRASAMRFGDPRIQAVLAAILLHAFLPMGFNNRQMREAVAQLLVTGGLRLTPGYP
ncbi:MAG: hypothetical protein OXK82_10590 [Deltaproteobacteria bacterium]|nr:hypothetical protein [Deltaproteobacteria bacterium]